MHEIATIYRYRVLLPLLALGLLALGASPAAADPSCRMVHARFFLVAEDPPTCGSPIGLCATVTIQGSIQAVSNFVGTSFIPTVDTGTTGVLGVTGDNTHHTADGAFFTKDAIVLSTTGDGEFAEVDVVTGGTGRWAGATGVLTATGTFANGSGQGFIQGQICVP